MALTDAAVRSRRPQKQRREIHDGNGLYLVIQPSGSRQWALRFRRPDGRPAKLTLGPVDLSTREQKGDPVLGAPLTLKAARLLASQQLLERARGIDPAAKRRADKQRKVQEVEDAAGKKFGTLVRKYIDDDASKHTRRWRQTAKLLGLNYPADGGEPSQITKGLVERWRDRDVTTLDGGDFYGVVDEARRTGIPGLERRRDGTSDTQGRAMAAALSSLCTWLVDHRKITSASNPATGMYKPPAPPARERVLNPAETRWFWSACDSVGEKFAPLLKLLLLTGARREEVAAMTRSELSDDGALWTIPGKRTKNGLPHVVHLPSLAREIIASVNRIEGKLGLVFTSTATTPLSGWSKVKARIDEAMLALAVKERGRDATVAAWRLHDLRRTCATGMVDIGVAPHVVEAVLNHISGHRAGVAGTYNRSQLLPERRAALNAWARYVGLLLDANLHDAYQTLLAKGDEQDQEKARQEFKAAIMDGGERWSNYLACLTGKPFNVVPMPKVGA